MVDEANPTGAPVADEPTPEPQPEQQQTTTATPPPQPEPEPEPPPWLTTPIDSVPSPPPAPQYGPTYGGPYPPYIPPPPPPGYWPPPQPPSPYPDQPGNIGLRDLAERPGEIIRAAAQREAMQLAMPLAQQLARVTQQLESMQVGANMQHEERAVAEFENARSAIRNAFTQQWSRDPALKNRAVQQRVWNAVEGYLREGAIEAKTQGSTRKWRTLQDPRALNLILYDAKQQAGWSDQTGRISIQGGFVESSRSQPSGGAEIDDEMRQAAKDLGVDPELVAKKAAERKKMWGW